MSGAPLGNQNATKLTTPELKKEAYRQYCEHLAAGYSQESFVFKHPEITLTYKTLNKYIDEDPIEFPAIHREVAKIEGYKMWEGVLMGSAKGLNKDANTASLQMIMRNKYGWDKEDREKANSCASDKILEMLLERK